MRTEDLISSINHIASISACSTEEVANALLKINASLGDLNISIRTADNSFRNLEDVLYDLEETYSNQLRPVTLEEAENSNEKVDFDFLNQNAYDHINLIFSPSETDLKDMFLFDTI